jgi:hypothetical protein
LDTSRHHRSKPSISAVSDPAKPSLLFERCLCERPRNCVRTFYYRYLVRADLTHWAVHIVAVTEGWRQHHIHVELWTSLGEVPYCSERTAALVFHCVVASAAGWRPGTFNLTMGRRNWSGSSGTLSPATVGLGSSYHVPKISPVCRHLVTLTRL